MDKQISVNKSLLDAITASLQAVTGLFEQASLTDERKLQICKTKLYEIRDLTRTVINMARLEHPEQFGGVPQTLADMTTILSSLMVERDALLVKVSANADSKTVVELGSMTKKIEKLTRRIERIKTDALKEE